MLPMAVTHAGQRFPKLVALNRGSERYRLLFIPYIERMTNGAPRKRNG